MDRRHYRWNGVLLGSITAGPIFLTAAMLADYYLKIPEAVTVNVGILPLLPVALLFASAIGFFIAILPAIVGTALLSAIARRFEAARQPIMWAVAGATIGTAFVTQVDIDEPAIAFGIVVASASSARLSRMSLDCESTD